MTDMNCGKTMTPCLTPGMCAPHGGCPSTESVSSAWLAQLRSEYLAFAEQNTVLKAECERLRADALQSADDIHQLENRNAQLVGFLRELRDQVLTQLISEGEPAHA